MIFRKKESPFILEVQKIWDYAPLHAMTDLLYFKDRWLCLFREADSEEFGQEGIIRIISSLDGQEWSTQCLFAEAGIDLREPKLSITPDGRLMLLVIGAIYNPKTHYVSRQSRVAFSVNGYSWTPFNLILESQESLYRLTWYKGLAYGISCSPNPVYPYQGTQTKLFSSPNGIDYSLITILDIPGSPSEGTIAFSAFGQMISLIRRDKKGDDVCWVGTSLFPFQQWRWRVLQHHLAAPNFIIRPTEQMWATGRLVAPTPYGIMEKIALLRFRLDTLEPMLILPSGKPTGDTGMVCADDVLWISYHSSHEGKSAIYLAKVQLPD